MPARSSSPGRPWRPEQPTGVVIHDDRRVGPIRLPGGQRVGESDPEDFVKQFNARYAPLGIRIECGASNGAAGNDHADR